MTTSLRLSIIFCFLLLPACKQQKQSKPFAPDQWRRKEGGNYPARAQMLDDLITRRDLHGISKDSLLQLLGPPDRSNNGYLYYKIAEEKIGFFTLHTRTLVFKLQSDSLVEWIRLHE